MGEVLDMLSTLGIQMCKGNTFAKIIEELSLNLMLGMLICNFPKSKKCPTDSMGT